MVNDFVFAVSREANVYPRGRASWKRAMYYDGMCQNIAHSKIWTRSALYWPLSGRHAIWKDRLRSVKNTPTVRLIGHPALPAAPSNPFSCVPPVCDRWSFHTPDYFLESRFNVLAWWRDRWCMMNVGRVLFVGCEEWKYHIQFIGWKM